MAVSTLSGPAPDESTTGHHLPALDGIRGTAVILVLLRHLFVRNPFASGSLPIVVVTRLLATGWIGVDLFFVLSGFLITGILYDTRHTAHFFRNFYARRALRIFPLYYGVIFVLMMVSLAAGHHWMLNGTVRLLTYTNTLFPQGLGATDTPWINLNHMWSLQIEEQFYLVWPLTVFLLRTRRRIAIAAICLASTSFLLRCTAVWTGFWPHYPYALYSWTPARLDGLLLGAALAMAVRSKWREKVLRAGLPIFVTGTLLILVSIFTIHVYSPDQNALVGAVGPLLFAITFTALVACALPIRGAAARVLSNAGLRFFGRLSYGLYVYHWLLHGMFDNRLHDWFMDRTQSLLVSTTGAGAVELLASVAIAWLSFRYLEQPLLQFKNLFSSQGAKPQLQRIAASHATRQGDVGV